MIIFFVTVSLTLNILAFLIMAILFLRQNKLIKMEENLKKPINEMEEVISAYILQMKEENDRFIQRIIELKKDGEGSQLSSTNSFGEVSNAIEHEDLQASQNPFDQANHQQSQMDSTENYTSLIGKTISNQAVKAYRKQTQRESETKPLGRDKEMIEQRGNDDHTDGDELIIQQISRLRNQGYSIDDIAKKLNKGKTEIDLLLKFQENIQE